MPTPRLVVARSLALVAGGLLVAGLSACASGPIEERDAQVRENLTPELDTLAHRDIDTDNRQVLSIDENLRQANEDWYRLWLVDRPSRLSRHRMPR